MNRLAPLLLGLTAIVASVAAEAQITLYGQEGLRGRAFTFEGPVENLQGSRMNERASSVTVRDGSWQLCSEAWYRGACVTLGPGDYPSLRTIGLDNRVSSVREIGWNGGDGRSGGPSIVLYDQPSFLGRTVRVEGVVDSLEQFNDRARSMIIYSGEWELCQHDRFRGDCMVFREGQHANLGPLSGDVSSLRPLSAPPATGAGEIGGWGRGSRAVLYAGTGFRGRSIVVNDNIVDNLQGSGFNDQVSSLRVERGYWLFCSDAHFNGSCRTFGPGDYPELPAALNDRISSGRRIHRDYPYERAPDWARGG